jgi:hypothetical protein
MADRLEKRRLNGAGKRSRKGWSVAQRVWIILLGAALAVLFSAVALAHRPDAIGGMFDGPAEAVRVTDPDISQVVYGDMPVARPSLWVGIAVAAATDLYVQLGVPAIERLRTFRPQMAIVGPGLPSLALPFAVPSGMGGILVVTSSVADGAFLHEPVTNTDSWVLGEASVHVFAAGTYYVVVWSSSIVDGKAWVAVGQREAFGWKDIMTLPKTINAVRAFHEVGLDQRLVTTGKLLFLVAVAFAIAGLVRLQP